MTESIANEFDDIFWYFLCQLHWRRFSLTPFWKVFVENNWIPGIERENLHYLGRKRSLFSRFNRLGDVVQRWNISFRCDRSRFTRNSVSIRKSSIPHNRTNFSHHRLLFSDYSLNGSQTLNKFRNSNRFVFFVSRKIFFCTKGKGNSFSDNCFLFSDSNEMSDDIFVVEKILDKRRSESGENEFLIKWFGYDEQDASWEPEENVFCKDLILIFERSEDFVVRRERETNSMKKKNRNSRWFSEKSFEFDSRRNSRRNREETKSRPRAKHRISEVRWSKNEFARRKRKRSSNDDEHRFRRSSAGKNRFDNAFAFAQRKTRIPIKMFALPKKIIFHFKWTSKRIISTIVDRFLRTKHSLVHRPAGFHSTEISAWHIMKTLNDETRKDFSAIDFLWMKIKRKAFYTFYNRRTSR